MSFRLIDKAQGKTKNDLFREMVEEVLAWGLAPAMVSADSWFSGVENLKFLREQGLGFVVGLEKNRQVSACRGQELAVESVDLPQSGQVLYLRKFGFVSVFRTVNNNNNGVRHYAVYDPRKKSA